MFDVGWSELLLIIILAVIFIGPQQMPLVAYKLGRVIGAFQRTVTHVRMNIENMAHMAEAEEKNRHVLEQEKRDRMAKAQIVPEREHEDVS